MARAADHGMVYRSARSARAGSIYPGGQRSRRVKPYHPMVTLVCIQGLGIQNMFPGG